MPTILRIDVDRAYEKRIMHYARVNQELFPALDSLGYLRSCKVVVEDLNRRGIKATLFFQPFTVPNKDFAEELLKKGHSVGLHVVHTRDYKDFSRDLNKISKRFDGEVFGWTKHESGKFKSLFNPELFLSVKWANQNENKIAEKIYPYVKRKRG
jgi:hypothetical protein